MVVTVPEVPSRCRPSSAAVLGGEAIDVDRDLRDHRLEQLAARPSRRRGARPASRRRSAAKSRPRSAGCGGPCSVGRAAARAARARTSRRRCRTGSRPRRRDRSAACSRWRPAAPRSRGRRFRARCRPRCGTRSQEFDAVAGRAAGLGRDQARAGDAAVAHLVAADAQRLDRAHDRGLAQPAGAGDALAEPDDARERVDHAEAVAGRRAPPAAGSCWCRDRARHRSGRTHPARPARRRRLDGLGADADTATAGPAGALVSGSRSGAGSRPVARASSSIENLSPRRSSLRARRRGGDFQLRGKV